MSNSWNGPPGTESYTGTLDFVHSPTGIREEVELGPDLRSRGPHWNTGSRQGEEDVGGGPLPVCGVFVRKTRAQTPKLR